jgi:ferrochelatase
MGGYVRAVEAARQAMGTSAPDLVMAGEWHLQPAYIGAVAGRLRTTLEGLHASGEGDIPVLLTAHSLPRRVADQEPGYLEQLRETADAIAAAALLKDGQWTFCWQSAGHEPGEWMKPDFADLMPGFATAGHGSVVVAPVQFLADHLEILYDIDIGARAQAEAVGLRLTRTDSLNTDPGLIAALASVVQEVDAAARV